jgi:hypothetical protein
MTYFNGDSITNAMLRIRGTPGNENYSLLIDEEMIIGWDNILRGKFTKQWKIQQQAYITRRRLKNPALHARKEIKRRKERRNKIMERIKAKRRRKTGQKHSTYSSKT